VLFVSLAGADVLGLALLWRVPALTRLEPLPPAAFDALGRSAPLPDTADQDAFAAEIEAMATPATPIRPRPQTCSHSQTASSATTSTRASR